MASHTQQFATPVTWLRRLFRRSQVPLGMLAVLVGLMAGLTSVLQGAAARLMQRLLYGMAPGERLSAMDHISVMHLLALPLGGLLVTGAARLMRRGRAGRRAPIDVVEANALYGGDIPLRDSALVSAQTILSNGCGASVGLEAAYAQVGGGLAAITGQW
ncbi:MAG TPA: chloride channel protein, partial [Novosphingobium sp.]|nr:chloride channel protein [Novosphingobium sp.]